MQRLEVSGVVRLICRSLGVKGLNEHCNSYLRGCKLLCAIFGFRSGVREYSVLGWDALSLGSWCRTFRDDTVVSSSRVEIPKKK